MATLSYLWMIQVLTIHSKLLKKAERKDIDSSAVAYVQIENIASDVGIRPKPVIGCFPDRIDFN